MINHTALHEIKYLISKYEEWNDQVWRVFAGSVDATIHGRYFGDKLSPENKAILQKLALDYVASEMWEIRVQLAKLGFQFDDSCADPFDLAIHLSHIHDGKLEVKEKP